MAVGAIFNRILSAGAIVAFAAGTVVGVVPARGQDAPPADAIQTLLVVEKSDLSKVFVDPRDKRLADALAMVPARIRELPGEIEQFPPDAPTLVNAVLSVLTRPGRMGITVNAGNPADGLFGYGVVLSAMATDQKDAENLHALVTGVLKNAQLPPPPSGAKRFETMQDSLIPGGLGRLSFGPRKTADGWRFEVIVGTLDNPDPAWKNLPKASVEGLTPIVSGMVDLSGLTPAANLLGTMAGRQNPEVGQILREAGQAGIWGPNAMKIRFEVGHTATEMRSRVAVIGASKFRAKAGVDSGELTAADLAAVPADAAMASLLRFDLGGLDSLLGKALERGGPQAQQGLDEFKAQTGVDLREDVLKTIGGTMACYTSEATGGGGLGSVVGLIGFKDRAKFLGAHTKLVKFINSAVAQDPKAGKYFQITAWKEGAVEMISLRFFGVPVPLDVTYAPTERYLVLGLTPQATLAAVRQINGQGDKGLGSIAEVASVMKGKKASAFSYTDSAYMIKMGYPIISMAGSAIANAVRSPLGSSGVSREPGMLVPMYQNLAKGAKPNLMVSYWNGEDYIIDTHGDRCMLVGAASAAGALSQFAPLLAAAGAAAAGAREQQAVHMHDEIEGHDDGMMEPEPEGNDSDDGADATRAINPWFNRLVPLWPGSLRQGSPLERMGVVAAR